MKRQPTPKQIAANLANAQKSTGPKTAEGRARSAQNALGYGICSTAVLLDDEDNDPFHNLHERFVDHYQPCGPVEEMLVDQVVTCHWRLGRVLQAEVAETRLQKGCAQADHRMATMLAMADPEKRKRCKQQEGMDPEDKLMWMGRYGAAVVPGAEALEKLGRYETRLHRQLFRALTHLEKLQKERKGGECRETSDEGRGRVKVRRRNQKFPNKANRRVTARLRPASAFVRLRRDKTARHARTRIRRLRETKI